MDKSYKPFFLKRGAPKVQFLSVIWACAFSFVVADSSGQDFRINKLEVVENSVSVEVTANNDYYYVLDRLDLNLLPTVVLDVKLGNQEKLQLSDTDRPATSGFYQVRRLSRENPGDLDMDQMDDVYELSHPGLNPLDPTDANRIVQFAGESTTELDAYRNNYEVGRGRYDITGLAADGSMMGYADGDQRSKGIHDRQWARAFIVKDRMPPHRRVVHVVVDNGQVFQSISQGVHDKIRADNELNEFYSYENIVLTATHTHGAAGGHSHFALFHASIGGYSWRTYDALVHGIYMAIKRAHRDLKPGGFTRNRGNLLNANENRSPIAFLQNVEHTFSNALGNPYGTDNRDTEMLALRFEHKGVGPVAMFNWFPVHGVSVSKANKLLTGDNKGNAAYQFEKEKGAIYPGFAGYSADSTFVAGFANSNPGDLTANRRTLEPGGWPQNGTNDYGRADTIGTRQYLKARALFEGTDGKLAKVSGPIDYRHMYVDFNSVAVNPANLYPYNVPGVEFPFNNSLLNPPWPLSTSIGALGFEFAKGTLDGEALSPGAVNALILLLPTDPITEVLQIAHYPKDILITTAGLVKLAPNWLPISILRVGDIVILAVPGEFTSMAGWRLRKTVEKVFADNGQKVRAIISGLANSYSGYITTYEEYMLEQIIGGVPNQGYEAASTHFGAFTLAAYQTKFTELAQAMVTGSKVPVAPLSVQMPAHVRPDVPIVNPLDLIPFLDGAPPDNIVAATYHEPAGCPSGQFHDLFTGDCWSCPSGYERTIIPPITASDACLKPAYSEFSSATQHGAAGCPVGQFFELFSGSCWSCPAGYNQSVFPAYDPIANQPTGNGCHKPAFSTFTSALSQPATGGSTCPSGYVYDFILGQCYRCPSGYNKNVFQAWNSGSACERIEEQAVGANNTAGTGLFGTDCPSGYVFDFGLGRCYACPSTYSKHVFRAWNAGDACVRTVTLTAAAQSTAGTGGSDCPSGYVYDFILGQCYRCPTDYNKVILLAWNHAQACEKVTPEVFTAATRNNSGSCPFGQFLDIGLGTCWSCPSGYGRTVFSVTGNTACEKVNPAVPAYATQHGKFACEARNPLWFLDIGLGECWSCPAGAWRNLNPVNGGEACNVPRNFGELRPGLLQSYKVGEDTVTASFWAGHPGNVFHTSPANTLDTFFKIQRKASNGTWVTVRTDADWDTAFKWEETQFSGAATIEWTIPSNAELGTYRILHRGYSGDLFGVESYEGTSSEFELW